jgi:hypothetical protein
MADEFITAGFALLVVAGLLVSRRLTADTDKRGLSAILVKLYGLLSISAFGVLLATTSVESQVKTAGFTLLGTIAGFIAGKDVPDEAPHAKTATNGAEGPTSS